MAITNPDLWTMSKPGDPTDGYEAAQAERNAIFEKIRPAGNWKLPIRAGINAADFDDCNRACIWFTGGALEVEEDLGAGGLLVVSPGYYELIGA